MSSSFEWLELETLSRDIATLEDRLHAARSTKNHGLMRLLEQQLSQAKSRRPIILEAITRHAAHSAAPPTVKTAKHKKLAPVLVEDPAVEDPFATPQLAPQEASMEPAEDSTAVVVQAIAEPEPEHQPDEGDSCASVVVPFSASTEGARTMWDQLTPDHLEKAKNELARRRAEIVSRHAQELNALQAEHDELEALNQAIDTFARKFSTLATGSEVVQIEEGQRMRG
ncbi:MAG TPA: hypothetical protein VHU15_00450 [Stellaceae bacterium]|jgi:hypothetical protein|nr:hypothetical protein [Stellaceae bacterium]